jgi:putative ABC transport system substrate-binding protein
MGTELDAKRLEILAEVLPARSTVLLLADPTTHRESRPALNSTAESLGFTLRKLLQVPEQIDVLREARETGGLVTLSSALLSPFEAHYKSRRQLGLPTMYQWPETADDGGLIAYGPSLLGAFRQVTALAVKILQGAKPGRSNRATNKITLSLTKTRGHLASIYSFPRRSGD